MNRYSQYIKVVINHSGKIVYLLEESAPGELIEMAKDCHLDCFFESGPNDWIFEHIYHALKFIEDGHQDIAYVPDFVYLKTPNFNLIFKWAQDNYYQFTRDLMQETYDQFRMQEEHLELLYEYGYATALERVFRYCMEWLEEINEKEERQ